MPRFGDVAQLGERRVRNAKVEGSIPFVSTNTKRAGLVLAFFILMRRHVFECVAKTGA